MFIRMIGDQPQRYTEHDLRRDNPTVSFPKGLSDQIKADYGLLPYERTTAPAHDPEIEKVSHEGFIEVGGVWRDNWVKTPLSAEEIAARNAAEIEETKQRLARPRSVEMTNKKALFILDRRLRVLEGKPLITWEQFSEWYDGQSA